MNDIKKNAISIGWRYTIFGLAVTVVQLFGKKLASYLYPEWAAANESLLVFLLIVLSVDIVGFPLIYLLLKKSSSERPEKHKMKFRQFIICVLMCCGLCGFGSLIGNVFHFVLTLPFGVKLEDTNKLALLMTNSNPFIRILVVGILAPVFEELIFRKVLIDHMAPYSKFGAVLMSGLMFGLFHGNFQQAFFAALLGMFFAYIYLRTGKIIYTILFHMIINLNSAAIVMHLAEKFSEASQSINPNLPEEELIAQSMAILPITLMYFGWLLFMLGCVITGIVLLIVKRKKFTLSRPEGVSQKGIAKAVLCNWGIALFYLVCVGLFLLYYVPLIMNALK